MVNFYLSTGKTSDLVYPLPAFPNNATHHLKTRISNCVALEKILSKSDNFIITRNIKVNRLKIFVVFTFFSKRLFLRILGVIILTSFPTVSSWVVALTNRDGRFTFILGSIGFAMSEGIFGALSSSSGSGRR